LVRESKTARNRSFRASLFSRADSLLLSWYRAGSIWRIYTFWTAGANTSVTFNVPPASSININAPLTPTVPALSPTALAITVIGLIALSGFVAARWRNRPEARRPAC